MIVRLTGFGQTGPYRARPGFARMFEAMSGFTSLTGEEGGSPLHTNFPMGDAIAGLFTAFSIAAEIARLRGDPAAKGAEIDLSATEALFRLLDPLPVEHEQLGLVRKPAGNCASYTAPSNMYVSADRVLLLARRFLGRHLRAPGRSRRPARVGRRSALCHQSDSVSCTCANWTA